MTGVEINIVVSDSLEALKLYERIFEQVTRLEVTSFDKGQNEAVFNLYGTRFHLLDENHGFHLVAPQPGDPKPMWINLTVEDIAATFQRAMEAGCTQIQPVTELEQFGLKNAIFTDTFGHVWMLHQIIKDISFEERIRIIKEQMQSG